MINKIIIYIMSFILLMGFNLFGQEVGPQAKMKDANSGPFKDLVDGLEGKGIRGCFILPLISSRSTEEDLVGKEGPASLSPMANPILVKISRKEDLRELRREFSKPLKYARLVTTPGKRSEILFVLEDRKKVLIYDLVWVDGFYHLKKNLFNKKGEYVNYAAVTLSGEMSSLIEKNMIKITADENGR